LELGLMQPGIGMAGAQLTKPLLGGLFEPVKIGIRGQSLRHGKPSFSAPGDRKSRARKKGDVSSTLEVGSTLYAVRWSPAQPASNLW
jgi:hypothetical protein